MIQKFKRIYCLPNHKIRQNTNMDTLIFVWKNWDYYFSKKNNDKDLEVFENVELTTKFNKEKYIDNNYDKLEIYLQYA